MLCDDITSQLYKIFKWYHSLIVSIKNTYHDKSLAVPEIAMKLPLCATPRELQLN